MVFKSSLTDNFLFRPAMRGRSKNLRTLSSSSYSVLLKRLFGPNFYPKMRPLSLFFGLLLVTRDILTRSMTQFNSLTITSRTNQADTLHPLGPNFRTKIGSP